MRLGLASTAALFLIACATPEERVGVCFDGWSTDHVGASQLYEPTEDERAFVLQQVPRGYEIACWHLEGSGLKTAVLVARTEHPRTMTIASTEEGFAVESEGIIVSARP